MCEFCLSTDPDFLCDIPSSCATSKRRVVGQFGSMGAYLTTPQLKDIDYSKE